MRNALNSLAFDFRRLGMPEHGRYVDAPARADARGTISVPPLNTGDVARLGAAGLGALVLAAGAVKLLAGARSTRAAYRSSVRTAGRWRIT